MDFLLKLWKSKDVPRAAKELFTWLFEMVGLQAGVLESVTYQKIAAHCDQTEAATRKQIEALEQLGFVEREPLRGVGFNLFVKIKSLNKDSPPKKSNPTPILDFCEKDYQKDCEKDYRKVQRAESRVQSAEILQKPNDGHVPPATETPQKKSQPKQQEWTKAFPLLANSYEEAMRRTKRLNANDFGTKQPENIASSPEKNKNPLYISNKLTDQLTDLKQLTSIDMALKNPKNVRLALQVKKIASKKEEMYLQYLVSALAEEGILKEGDDWYRILNHAKTKENPGGYIQTCLINEFGKEKISHLRKMAVDHYLEKTKWKPRGKQARSK